MNRFTTLLLFVVFSLSVHAQAVRLSFNQDKNFKIAQFTDMHLGLNSDESRKEAKQTFERLERIVKQEKPDLIVFTGDIVTGQPALQTWKTLLDKVDVLNIPFGVVLGNHDPENASKEEIATLILQYKNTINKPNSNKELADIVIPINSSNKIKDKAFIYLMDSNDYSPIKEVKGYGWFTRNQIDWYVETSKAINPDKHPALAFFHIPFPEYTTAWDDKKNKRIGRQAETPCPPSINTGMFAAMVEMGDVIGTFVGHDHDNDYIVIDQGIALGYGRFSGDNTIYNNLRSGVRLIELTEDKRGFKSWIVEDNGRVVDSMRMMNNSIEAIKSL